VWGLLVFAGLYIFTNVPLEREERSRRGWWFALLGVPIAWATNAAFVAFSPGSSLGASGLVFALFGMAFGFCLFNTLDEFRKLVRQLRQPREDLRRPGAAVHAAVWLSLNALVFVYFLYYILLEILFRRALLFGIGEEGINASAHLLGFLLGFSITLLRNVARSRQPPHRAG
jgi:membrane associated rhomboid family serine protease